MPSLALLQILVGAEQLLAQRHHLLQANARLVQAGEHFLPAALTVGKRAHLRLRLGVRLADLGNRAAHFSGKGIGLGC